MKRASSSNPGGKFSSCQKKIKVRRKGTKKKYKHSSKSAMHDAIVHENVKGICELLRSGDKLCSADGYNCFFVACTCKKWNILKRLLEYNLRGLRCYGPNGQTLLMYEVDNFENFKYLLQLGANVKQESKFGLNVLNLAIKANASIEVLEAILKAGLSPSARDKGGSYPLMTAVKSHKICKGTGTIELLLQRSTEPISCKQNIRALKLAIELVKPEAVEVMLRLGVDALQQHDGETHAYHEAMDHTFAFRTLDDFSNKQMWPVLDVFTERDFSYFSSSFQTKLAEFKRNKGLDSPLLCAMLSYYFHFYEKNAEKSDLQHPQHIYMDCLQGFYGKGFEIVTKALLESPIKVVNMTIEKEVSLYSLSNQHRFRCNLLGCFILDWAFFMYEDNDMVFSEWLEEFMAQGFKFYEDDPEILSPLTILVANYRLITSVSSTYEFTSMLQLLILEGVNMSQQLLPIFKEDDEILRNLRRQLKMPDVLYIAAAYGKTRILCEILPFCSQHPLTLLRFLVPQIKRPFGFLNNYRPYEYPYPVKRPRWINMGANTERWRRREVWPVYLLHPAGVREVFELLLKTGGPMTIGSELYVMVKQHLETEAKKEEAIVNIREGQRHSQYIYRRFQEVHNVVPTLAQLCRNKVRQLCSPSHKLPNHLAALVPPGCGLPEFLTFMRHERAENSAIMGEACDELPQ